MRKINKIGVLLSLILTVLFIGTVAYAQNSQSSFSPFRLKSTNSQVGISPKNLSWYLGIGTTSPYAKLSVVGETVSEYFSATSTTATSTFAGILSVGTSSPALSPLFVAGDSFYVDKSGNVKIGKGTSTPTSILDITDSSGNNVFNIKDVVAGGNVNRINMLEGAGGTSIAINIVEDYTGVSTRNLLLLKLRQLGGGSGISRAGNYQLYLESATTGEGWAFVALARAKHNDANLSRLIGGYYRVQIQNNNTPTIAEADALLTEIDVNDGTMTIANHLYIPASKIDVGTGQIITNSGIRIDKQTVGDNNFAIMLNGDDDELGGAGLWFGASQDAWIGFNGTTNTLNFNYDTAYSTTTIMSLDIDNANVGIGTTSPSSRLTVDSGATATTTIEFGDQYSSNSKTCFNVKNNTGGNISFYFVGTSMVVENNRCN